MQPHSTRRFGSWLLCVALIALPTACSSSAETNGDGSVVTETAATPLEATATSAASETADDDLDGPEIDGLPLDSTESVIVALLGDPASRSPSVDEAATGDVVSTWSWPAGGVEAKMAVADGTHLVRSLTINAPATLRTLEGIGIGSSEADVHAAYGTTINAEESGPGAIVVGSVFGGLILTITDGAVSEMFVGAAAE